MSPFKVTPLRFEITQDGHTAYADYRRDVTTLYIDYVFAPEALRGTGAAGRLMAAIMDYAQSEALTIVPICGYAVAWLKRHPKTR